ncbi:MAG: lrgB [Peptococcaceae bacterium]|jgi:predicted murein hydrolase (TIGR00659 family)|nr:lrgB [Peptococcaceae bacterium]
MLIISILITLGAYYIGRLVFNYVRHPAANPVIVGGTLVILFLVYSGQGYTSYEDAKNVITGFLGPATVALAVPLYQNKKLLVRYFRIIMLSVFLGTLTTTVAVVWVAQLVGLEHFIVVSLAPKSVTAPIAIEVARMVGGDPALAAAFVVGTGTSGAVLGPMILTWLGVKLPLARGLALGTAAHGQGTAMALEEGELQGAMGGLAMGLAGIMTALILPWLLPLLL